VRLAHDQQGQADPPLVFVHGVACHLGFWAPQLQHFASAHQVLAVDLRGRGDSDAPAQRYTIRAFAAFFGPHDSPGEVRLDRRGGRADPATRDELRVGGVSGQLE
jgi:pimeloyl-ACP methyl ester carboxylesterase